MKLEHYQNLGEQGTRDALVPMVWAILEEGPDAGPKTIALTYGALIPVISLMVTGLYEASEEDCEESVVNYVRHCFTLAKERVR